MKIMNVIGGLILTTSVATAGEVFVELDHYSKLTKTDYGLTMANVGAEQCAGNLCLTGKLGVPVFDNDMYRDGQHWENDDIIGNVGVRYNFLAW